MLQKGLLPPRRAACARLVTMKLNALFGEQLFFNRGQAVPVDALQGHVVLLYFSAAWCGPCAAFTPQLIAMRERVQQRIVHFEVVFISSDRNEREFQTYFAKMPWLAPAFDKSRSEQLNDLFKVSGIPFAVVLFPNNTALKRDVVQAIRRDPAGTFIVDAWMAATGATAAPAPVLAPVLAPVSTPAPVSAPTTIATLTVPDKRPRSPPPAAHGASAGVLRWNILPAERAAATRTKQYLALYCSNEGADAGFLSALLTWYADMRAHAPADYVEVVFLPTGSVSAAFLARMPWVSVHADDAAAILAKYKPNAAAASLLALDQRTGALVCTNGAARLRVDGRHFPWRHAAWEPFEAVKTQLGKTPMLLLLLDADTEAPMPVVLDAFVDAANALRDEPVIKAVCSVGAACDHFRSKLELDPAVAVLLVDTASWSAHDVDAPLSGTAIVEFYTANQPLPLPF